MGGFLSGMKIVDLTNYIAGPFCTKLFADLGAEVIKIERPEGGDPSRRYGPFPNDIPHLEKSGLFIHLNSNKKSVTLNLKSSFGQEVVKKLVRDADIVVESFRPDVMERLGLSYQELRSINPRIIMTSISNYGQTGPYRHYKSSELTLFGMGGPMNSAGLADRYPLKTGGNHNQYQAGSLSALATMAAWYGLKYNDGPGQYIDISMMETQLASINLRASHLLGWAYRGMRNKRVAGAGAGGYPSGIYPCSDGYITVSGQMQRFPLVCKMIGRLDLSDNPRYAGAGQFDPEAQAEFESEVWLPWTLARTKMEVTVECQKHRILCGAINSVEEAIESPQFKSRDFFRQVEHPVAGRVTVPGAPFKTTAPAWDFRSPAPTLGQHNEEILCDRLGYSKEDVGQMAVMSLV